MFRPRIIPVLLLKDGGLVKSVKFKDHNYIGDPINAVKIYNDLRADELVFLDITAAKNSTSIPINIIKDIAEEANMPFSVGGGIKNIQQIKELIANGVEKVILGTSAAENPRFVREAADTFGSSTISVCIDVKKNFFGKEKVCYLNGTKTIEISPHEFALLMQEMGAGEIIIQSVDMDGTQSGYNLQLLTSIAGELKIPSIALGGADTLMNMKVAFETAGLSGIAAGSMFVYQGTKKGVLINYPSKSEINAIFSDKNH